MTGGSSRGDDKCSGADHMYRQGLTSKCLTTSQGEIAIWMSGKAFDLGVALHVASDGASEEEEEEEEGEGEECWKLASKEQIYSRLMHNSRWKPIRCVGDLREVSITKHRCL